MLTVPDCARMASTKSAAAPSYSGLNVGESAMSVSVRE
jgi:hypothetical protein